MGLTKTQAVALYTLLSTNSALVKKLSGKQYADADAFAAELKTQVNAIQANAAPGSALDFSQETRLGTLYGGDDGNGGTIIPRDASTIQAGIAALDPSYGGGACPGDTEQPGYWASIVNSGI
jgi:hypothetical protein